MHGLTVFVDSSWPDCFVSASKLEHCRQESRDQRADPAVEVVIDVAEALAWQEELDAAGEDDVFAQERPILKTITQVHADEIVDVSLKQELLQHRRLVEPDQVVVGDELKNNEDRRSSETSNTLVLSTTRIGPVARGEASRASPRAATARIASISRRGRCPARSITQ